MRRGRTAGARASLSFSYARGAPPPLALARALRSLGPRALRRSALVATTARLVHAPKGMDDDIARRRGNQHCGAVHRTGRHSHAVGHDAIFEHRAGTDLDI